jgi:hypothetical protein
MVEKRARETPLFCARPMAECRLSRRKCRFFGSSAPGRRTAPHRAVQESSLQMMLWLEILPRADQTSLATNRSSQNGCLGFPLFTYGAARKVAICMIQGLPGEIGPVAL